MANKIIQIATTPAFEDKDGDFCSPSLFGLGEDGGLYFLTSENKWKRIADNPNG